MSGSREGAKRSSSMLNLIKGKKDSPIQSSSDMTHTPRPKSFKLGETLFFLKREAGSPKPKDHGSLLQETLEALNEIDKLSSSDATLDIQQRHDMDVLRLSFKSLHDDLSTKKIEEDAKALILANTGKSHKEIDSETLKNIEDSIQLLEVLYTKRIPSLIKSAKEKSTQELTELTKHELAKKTLSSEALKQIKEETKKIKEIEVKHVSELTKYSETIKGLSTQLSMFRPLPPPISATDSPKYVNLAGEGLKK